MTRRTAAATAVAAILAVTGCSASPVASAPAASPSTPSTAPTPQVRAATASPSSSSATRSTVGVPEPGSMAEPATSSGSLSKASFPTPHELGPGWRYDVDPGDAEEGYSGNGTPALARSPREIVQTAVPFGCARTAAMPEPRHALEVDYTLHGAKVIAVRGRFSDRAQARSFFAGRSANLRGCADRSGSTAIGPLVAAISRPGVDAIASDRTPQSDPWREVAALDGESVVLLAAQGRRALSDPQTRRLVRLFR